jgi:glucose/arabinose dehydrogenase
VSFRRLWVSAVPLASVCLVVIMSASAASTPPGPGKFLGEGKQSAAAATGVSALPAGFQDTTVFSGLTFPTNLRFASDGRVFVAEKSGLIKVFSSLAATTPTVVADLRTKVDDYWDRGLLGLALDPNFPSSPYIYALYTYDAPIGGTAPVWNDACPTPPGPTTDGCVVSGRLSRLTIAGNTATSEQVLIEGWCQQYPSHSIGDLAFGPDGDLYVSAGEGANFNLVDYGQGGGGTGSPTPKNPCGDPPSGVGGTESPPTAEGGSLRSQSSRRPAGEPVLLNGAILRLDPATGAGASGNPNAGSSDPNKRRIIAYGLRNPFRFVFRPGTNEVWVGDVGWGAWEEVDRIVDPTAGVVNFGWPCYEGADPQPAYQTAGLNLCSSLYSAGSAAAPYFSYPHLTPIVSGESCPNANGSVISALAFYNGSSYPAAYQGALFFGDHSRNCIWVIPKGANGLPDPGQIQTFITPAANPVDLETGPNGDLFYVNHDGGTVERISYADLGTDKALRRPASASSSYSTSYSADRANDGDSTTRWSSAFADNQWWQADLGAVRQVDTVSLNWEAAYASSYKIQVSSDGSTFTDAANVSTTQPGWKTTTFTAVAARYVRVLGLTRATPYGISFWDAQVFGPPDTGGTVPVNISPPSIDGFAGQGQTLTASVGQWSTGSGAPTSYAYQWQRCNNSGANCQPLTGATASTYRVAIGDVGLTLKVAVVASNGAGSSDPADSAVTSVVRSDLALGHPASASSSYSTSYSADGANDGDSTTRWSSAFADNQWWQADLGAVRQVDTVSLNWEAAYASSYKIQVSSDGSTFTDAASVSTTQPGWKTTTFPAAAARYVRVLGVTRATQYGISFWDAQVFGPAGTPPTPVIDTPSSTLTWKVGDLISFSGHATDSTGTLPASALKWAEIIHHCTTPNDCHTHLIQTFNGVSSGSLNAPDHEYPSWLELELTATNSAGISASTSVRLDPKTVDLSFATRPTGLSLTVGSSTSVAPFTRTVIVNSATSVSAPATQTLNGTTYQFSSWSDNGAASHTITAPASTATYTATYTVGGGAPPVNTTQPSISGQPREGRTLTTTNGGWTGATPMTFKYQWRRCDSGGNSCVDIQNATASSYALTSADVGFRMRARVTATNSGGSASADSAPTVSVKAGH